MSKRLYILSIVVIGMQGCGSSDDDAVRQEWAACEPRGVEGALEEVDIQVESVLPGELDGECRDRSGTQLTVYMTIPDEPACSLVVGEGLVEGCCPKIDANQNVWVDLVYRHSSSGVVLGMQGRVVELPNTGDPVVTVSFEGVDFQGSDYDVDQDGVANFQEFCNDTL